MMTSKTPKKVNFIRQGLALTIFLLLGMALQAQTPTTGDVRGTITSADDGLPLAGALITLSQKGKQQQTAITNEDGNFKFLSLNPGKYTIKAESLGFVTQKETFYLDANRTRDINMGLKIKE